MRGPITCSALMCHAPIVIPEIGDERDNAKVGETTRAMKAAASRIVAHRPDALVVLSPHARRDPWGWTLADDHAVQGNFAAFGARRVGFRLAAAPDAARQVESTARELGLQCRRRSLGQADHGASVPLYFMVDAGWRGPTLIVSFPYHPEHNESRTMGQALRLAALQREEHWAIIASGDMSHRLRPGAPSGYHPRARDFDFDVAEQVRAGHYQQAVEIDSELRRAAAEDMIDSLEVASSAVAWDARGHRILSYEAPYGVGYLVALLHDEGERPDAGVTPRSLHG